MEHILIVLLVILGSGCFVIAGRALHGIVYGMGEVDLAHCRPGSEQLGYMREVRLRNYYGAGIVFPPNDRRDRARGNENGSSSLREGESAEV